MSETSRPRALTEQIVVRVTPGLYEALRRDAETFGRTVAQSTRYHLSRVFEDQARAAK